MPAPTIALMDAARIPDVSSPVTFHADATYVFDYLQATGIPGINAALTWMDAALAGDAETLIDSLSAHLAADNPHNVTPAQIGAVTPAEMTAALGAVDAVTVGGQPGAYYLNATNMNAGVLPLNRLAGSYNINIAGSAAAAVNSDMLDGLHHYQFAAPAIRKVGYAQFVMAQGWNQAPAGYVITGLLRAGSGFIDNWAAHALQIQRADGIWLNILEA